MEQNKQKIYELFPLMIYCLTIYFFVLGAAHTLGKWFLFPINIFDFMGVVDIAKSAAPNVLFVLLVLVIQSILIYLANKKSMLAIVGNGTGIENFLNRTTAIFMWVMIVVVIVSAVGLTYVFSKGHKFIIEYSGISTVAIYVPLALLFIMVYMIIINESVKRTIAWHYYSMVLFTLALAPFFSFTIGLLGAVKVINGQHFNYVTTGVENGIDDIMTRDRYLGYYADRYFVWSPLDGVIKTISGSQYFKIKKFNGDKLE